jgi:hypothetical protein
MALQKVAQFDFSSATVFAGVKLSRLAGVAAIDNSPVAVVATRDKIIDGHNGIFQSPFLDFLTDYIAFIEAKRAVLRFQRLEEQRLSGAAAASDPDDCPPGS